MLLTVNFQVFSSFVIHSGIAVLALAALIILEFFSTKPEEAPDPDDKKKHDEPRIELQTPLTKHRDNLITALVEFHKAQCYFASTIQITALILFHQNQSDISTVLKSNEPIFDKELIDRNVLVLLATSASVHMCGPCMYHTLRTPFMVCDRLINDHCPPGYSHHGFCVFLFRVAIPI